MGSPTSPVPFENNSGMNVLAQLMSAVGRRYGYQLPIQEAVLVDWLVSLEPEAVANDDDLCFLAWFMRAALCFAAHTPGSGLQLTTVPAFPRVRIAKLNAWRQRFRSEPILAVVVAFLGFYQVSSDSELAEYLEPHGGLVLLEPLRNIFELMGPSVPEPARKLFGPLLDPDLDTRDFGSVNFGSLAEWLPLPIGIDFTRAIRGTLPQVARQHLIQIRDAVLVVSAPDPSVADFTLIYDYVLGNDAYIFRHAEASHSPLACLFAGAACVEREDWDGANTFLNKGHASEPPASWMPLFTWQHQLLAQSTAQITAALRVEVLRRWGATWPVVRDELDRLPQSSPPTLLVRAASELQRHHYEEARHYANLALRASHDGPTAQDLLESTKGEGERGPHSATWDRVQPSLIAAMQLLAALAALGAAALSYVHH